MHMCLCVHTCMWVQVPQAKASAPLELGLCTDGYELLLWVLGTDLRSPAGAVMSSEALSYLSSPQCLTLPLPPGGGGCRISTLTNSVI